MTRTFQMLQLVVFIVLQSCSGQSGSKQGGILKGKVDAVMDSYHKPTSKDNLYLEAKVDGEKWVSDWMFVDPDPGKTFNVNAHKGGDEGSSVISFYISSNTVKEKGSQSFSEMDQVQLVDGNIFLFGNEGGYHITNVTGNWIEGDFHCTVKDDKSGQTRRVTDGFFRVSLPGKWKASM